MDPRRPLHPVSRTCEPVARPWTTSSTSGSLPSSSAAGMMLRKKGIGRPFDDAIIVEGDIDGLQELNEALNDLIDIVLSNYVSSWYPSISPTDRSFILSLRSAITSFLNRLFLPFYTSFTSSSDRSAQGGNTRAVCRSAKENIVRVLVLELPEILARHYEGWRMAEKLADDFLESDAEDLPGAPDPQGALRDHDGWLSEKGRPVHGEVKTDRTQARRRMISGTFLRIHPRPGMMQSGETGGGAVSKVSQSPPTDPPSNAQSLGSRSAANSSQFSQSPTVPALDPAYLPRLIAPLLQDHFYLSHPIDVAQPALGPVKTTTTVPPSPIVMELTREIIGNAVLGGVVRKMSEGWMIWRILLGVLGNEEGGSVNGPSLGAQASPRQTVQSGKKVHGADSPGFITVSILSAAIFSFVHLLAHRSLTLINRISSALLSMSGVATRLKLDWKDATAITNPPSNPDSTGRVKPDKEAEFFGVALETSSIFSPTIRSDAPAPSSRGMDDGTYVEVLDPWSMLLGTILRVNDPIMPGGRVRRSVWRVVEMFFFAVRRPVDALIPLYVRNRLLTPRVSALIVRKIQTAVFPNGKVAPSVPDPTLEEQDRLREDVERKLEKRLPAALGRTLLGQTLEERLTAISDILEPLSDSAVNTHLLLTIIDAVVLAVSRDGS